MLRYRRGAVPRDSRNCLRRRLGGIGALPPRVRVVDVEDDEPGVQFVRHLATAAGHEVDTGEASAPALIPGLEPEVGLDPPPEFSMDRVGVAFVQRCAVLGQLGHRWLGRIPVPGAILVEVRRGLRQPPDRIAEDLRRFAGHHAAELHATVIEAAVGRARHSTAWRRERMPRAGMLLQVDGSHHAWLEQRGPRFALLLAVDDATGAVVHALFRPAEDARGYFLLMEQVLRRSGIPLALYSDRHAVFRASAQQRAGGEASTQMA